jgi:hypothetical protein
MAKYSLQCKMPVKVIDENESHFMPNMPTLYVLQFLG